MNREISDINPEKTREHLNFEAGVSQAAAKIRELFKENRNVCILIRGYSNHVGKTELMKAIRKEISDYKTGIYIFSDISSMKARLEGYNHSEADENENNLLIIDSEFSTGVVLKAIKNRDIEIINETLRENTSGMPISVNGVDLSLFIYDKNAPPEVEENETINADLIIANDKVDYNSSKPRH